MYKRRPRKAERAGTANKTRKRYLGCEFGRKLVYHDTVRTIIPLHLTVERNQLKKANVFCKLCRHSMHIMVRLLCSVLICTYFIPFCALSSLLLCSLHPSPFQCPHWNTGDQKVYLCTLSSTQALHLVPCIPYLVFFLPLSRVVRFSAYLSLLPV